MKNKSLLFLGAVLIVSIFSTIGCKEEVDNDIITGKWVEKDIQKDTTVADCVKTSYIEFSEYDIDFRKRVLSFNNVCDTVYRSVGNYTINGDTLVIKDTMNVTKLYTIQFINDKEMRFTEPNMVSGGLIYHNYLRFDK